MPSLLLVRHGQALPAAGADPGLSPLGLRQAGAAARTLAAQEISFSLLSSGSLARQRETLGELGPLPQTPDPRWNEYDVHALLTEHPPAGPVPEPHVDPRGFQEGLDQALAAWMAAPAEGAGSWRAMRAGVDAALAELAAGLGSGRSAVVATSGGPIAAVCAGLLGLDVAGTIALHRVLVNAGITRLISGRAGLRLASFNEQAHLAGGLLTYR